jgi:hypothetical protein
MYEEFTGKKIKNITTFQICPTEDIAYKIVQRTSLITVAGYLVPTE